jgi:hypothetical protein
VTGAARLERVGGTVSFQCLSCPEGMPVNECHQSQRPCGHHCNCSWVHDHCHWCDTEFGEEGV